MANQNGKETSDDLTMKPKQKLHMWQCLGNGMCGAWCSVFVSLERARDLTRDVIWYAGMRRGLSSVRY